MNTNEHRDAGITTGYQAESVQDLILKRAQIEADLRAILNDEIDAILDPTNNTLILSQEAMEMLWRREKQLLKERQRYQDLFDFAPDGYLVTDVEGTIQEANKAAAALFGSQQGLLPGRRLSEFIVPEELQNFQTMLDQLKENEKVLGWETTIRLPDGGSLPVVMIVASQRDLWGSTLSLRWQMHDISERKLAAESLRASQQKLISIVTGAPLILWAVDSKMTITYFEGKSLATMGVDGHEFIGEHISKFFTNSPRLLGDIESALEGEEVVGTLNARGRVLETRYSPLRGAKKEVMGVIGVSIDITSQKQLEADLAELNRRLVQGRENDRLQLSKEIHDGPVQDMYGILFHLKAFVDSLPAEINQSPIRILQENMGQVIDTLRTICGELRPPTLAPFGLEKAIRSHSAMFQKANPQLVLELNLMSDGLELPELVRLALFRIYQQALNNVSRHANASTVLVHLEIMDDQVALVIQDDGDGFELPEKWIQFARDNRLGLIDAIERAQSVGGQLLIETAPEKGTILRTVIPR